MYMKEAINENKDFLKPYSQTRQDVFIRLLKAFRNFFSRCEEKESWKEGKGGFFLVSNQSIDTGQ